MKNFMIIIITLFSFSALAKDLNCAMNVTPSPMGRPFPINGKYLALYGNQVYSLDEKLKYPSPTAIPLLRKILGTSEDNRYLYAVQANGRVNQKFDLTNLFAPPIDISEEEVATKFSGSYSRRGTMYYYDHKQEHEYRLPKSCQEDNTRACIIKDSILYLFTKNTNEIIQMDLEGKKIYSLTSWPLIEEQYQSFFVDENFNLLAGDTVLKFDPNLGSFNYASIEDQLEFYRYGKEGLPVCREVGDKNKEFDGICTNIVDNKVIFLHLNIFDCRPPVEVIECNDLSSDNNITQQGIKLLDDLNLKMACNQDFDEKLWDQITPLKKELSKEEAIKWIYRFSKPGGYNEEKHHAILAGISESGLLRSFTNIKQFLKLNLDLELNPESNLHFDNTCLSPKEKKDVQIKLLTKLKEDLKSNISPSQEEYEKLKKLIAILTPDQINDFVGALTDLQAMAIGSGDYNSTDENTALSKVFTSKTVHFLESIIQKKLGLPYKDLNDITLVQHGDKAMVLRLSTTPFEKSKEANFGIHAKILNMIDKKDISEDQVLNISYKANNKKHKAVISISPVEGKMIDQAISPNYEELLQDKVLRGLIITNQADNNGHWTMDAYMAYYTRKGCIFDRSKSTEVSTQDFLKEKVSGPNVADYFIKEAHSDGDDINLFSSYKRSTLLTCSKQNADGTKEEVDLLIPILASGEEKITNENFGKWMGERVKQGQGQLLYINSSCYSKSKAIHEIPAVAENNPLAASKLVNIASNSYVYFYRDPAQRGLSLADQNNSKGFILDGIRNKKTYAEIRESMKKDPRYSQTNENQFMFPDEERYQETIGKTLTTPISVHVNTFIEETDGTMREYTLTNY
ncbi:MAG: hypothetical protein AB7I27_15235 [Bacteriovoracaceae bacterium]